MPVDMPTLERNADVAATQWGEKNLCGNRERAGYKAGYIAVHVAFAAAKDAEKPAAAPAPTDKPTETFADKVRRVGRRK